MLRAKEELRQVGFVSSLFDKFGESSLDSARPVILWFVSHLGYLFGVSGTNHYVLGLFAENGVTKAPAPACPL